MNQSYVCPRCGLQIRDERGHQLVSSETVGDANVEVCSDIGAGRVCVTSAETDELNDEIARDEPIDE